MTSMARSEVMDRLEAAGIDMDAVTKQLEVDGVKSFADSFDKLIASTEEKVADCASRRPPPVAATNATPPAAAAAAVADRAPSLRQPPEGDARGRSSRRWTRRWIAPTMSASPSVSGRRIPTLWKPIPAQQGEITDRLGWLTVMEQMSDDAAAAERPARRRARAGFTHCVLLGMGGSSLAPEVLRGRLARRTGHPSCCVLDSTDPATILAVVQAMDLAHTLFIVASKSGGTIETLSQFSYFYDRCASCAGRRRGRSFIAITDPGTTLDELAQNRNFRAIFRNPPDIGGRYSALSYFGLVPAAIIGVDVGKLLDRAEAMARPARRASPRARTLASGWARSSARWPSRARQSDPHRLAADRHLRLLAGATDRRKHRQRGQGHPAGGGRDAGRARGLRRRPRLRLSAHRTRMSTPRRRAPSRRFEAAGHPVVRLRAARRATIWAQEFFRWEFATAVAGALLGINAFDQPNVQEAKDNTDRLLQEYSRTRALPQPRAILQTQTRNVCHRRRGRAGRPHARRDLAPGGDRGLRAQAALATTSRCWPTCRRRAKWTTRCNRSACGCATAARRDDARLWAALPALDGAVPQGWAEYRASSSSSSPPIRRSC